MIQLDTSLLIRALVRGSSEDQMLRSWLADAKPVGISGIAWTEFLCGPVASNAVELASRAVGAQLPFTSEHSAAAAHLFNVSGRRRGTLVDCMVAATALGGNADVATANPRDFQRFEQVGLRVVTR